MVAVLAERPQDELRSRQSRARLAAMVVRLFDHWQLTATEQAGALGLSATSRSALARYRGGEPFADSRDLLDRAGHLLGIHKALRTLLPHNRELAYRWMTQPNRRFGSRPIDLVMKQGFEGLLHVRRHLDYQLER
jgi:hypothetical protein